MADSNQFQNCRVANQSREMYRLRKCLHSSHSQPFTGIQGFTSCMLIIEKYAYCWEIFMQLRYPQQENRELQLWKKQNINVSVTLQHSSALNGQVLHFLELLLPKDFQQCTTSSLLTPFIQLEWKSFHLSETTACEIFTRRSASKL